MFDFIARGFRGGLAEMDAHLVGGLPVKEDRQDRNFSLIWFNKKIEVCIIK